MMTAKDYELIAACLGGAFNKVLPQHAHIVEDVQRRLMLEMKLDNPRFDEERFERRVAYWTKAHAADGRLG